MSKKVVFILGIGRSGSTLIDLMLGSHSQGFSLGEISKLPERFTKGVPIAEDTNFWSDYFTEQELSQLAQGFANQRLTEYIPLKVERFVRELTGQDRVFRPYSLLCSKIQASVLVDSSKYPYWVTQQLSRREFKRGDLKPYILWIVRDGRAVINSYRRVYPNWTFKETVDRWQRVMTEAQRFFQALPVAMKKQIQYEALASDPDKVLADVCGWLEIPFEPQMVEYWTHTHHYICGGRGTRALLRRYRGIAKDSTESVHGDYYSKADFAIKLDLRWQQELAASDIEAFYAMTGDLNKPYEWNLSK